MQTTFMLNEFYETSMKPKIRVVVSFCSFGPFDSCATMNRASSRLQAPKSYAAKVVPAQGVKRSRDDKENSTGNSNKRRATRSQSRPSKSPARSTTKTVTNRPEPTTKASLLKENAALKAELELWKEKCNKLQPKFDNTLKVLKAELNKEVQQNKVYARKLEEMGIDAVSLVPLANLATTNQVELQKQIENRLTQLSANLAERKADVERRLLEVKNLPDPKFGSIALMYEEETPKALTLETQEQIQFQESSMEVEQEEQPKQRKHGDATQELPQAEDAEKVQEKVAEAEGQDVVGKQEHDAAEVTNEQIDKQAAVVQEAEHVADDFKQKNEDVIEEVVGKTNEDVVEKVVEKKNEDIVVEEVVQEVEEEVEGVVQEQEVVLKQDVVQKREEEEVVQEAMQVEDEEVVVQQEVTLGVVDAAAQEEEEGEQAEEEQHAEAEQAEEEEEEEAGSGFREGKCQATTDENTAIASDMLGQRLQSETPQQL